MLRVIADWRAEETIRFAFRVVLEKGVESGDCSFVGQNQEDVNVNTADNIERKALKSICKEMSSWQ
jgi:hypothetical protein